MTLTPGTITLNSGAVLPRIGLGTWPLTGADAERAVASGIEVGYRHLDTAAAYGNEKAVGAAVNRSGVARSEMFVTSKIQGKDEDSGDVRGGLERSLTELDLEYLDLYLIHWPRPRLDRYVETFTAMRDLVDEGLIRTVGVSNFKPAHLERLISETGQVPAINQIQLNTTLARLQTRECHARHGIVTGAWSPLGSDGTLLREPIVVALAEKYGRTPAQIALRWHVQQDIVAVPRSVDPKRQAQNLDVFGFALEPAEIDELTSLDRGEAAAHDADLEERT
ncbi:aldo/keto reductase [Rhodococcus sp. 24CO]|uniref:aldo/keto reductase n=1 Tax=Rhodococcus sp. 24CO TaxID=3117460 RepID=UPI003D34F27F